MDTSQQTRPQRHSPLLQARRRIWLATIAAGALVGGTVFGFVACGGDGAKAAVIDPAKFVARVDNPYFPLKPGSRWVYESADGKERVEVVVLTETRKVLGIDATVVRDTVMEDGQVVEDTLDWYAQDIDGNVWYWARTRRSSKTASR
ncbi:MAG: hypothetical protein ACR2HN_02270 [Tepidiformaceae bacterium]